MQSGRPRPIILIILDGWGYSENPAANAIAAANTPFWDNAWETYPHILLKGSGSSVGLPHGQMGNSEVGHLTMGSGRLIYQDLTRIDLSIENGEFYRNSVLLNALIKAQQKKGAIHMMGLLSPGGVHSHEKHTHALLELAAKHQLTNVYLHAFLDGRDTPPQSAMTSLDLLNSHCQELGCGKIVSIIGRYYAMDRDKRWERIQEAYNLLTLGQAKYHAPTAKEGLLAAYARGETDEFVQATCIHEENTLPTTISDEDIVFFMNFRSDRAREITQAFTDPQFHEFTREKIPHLQEFVCLSAYNSTFTLPVAYPPQSLKNILAACVSDQHLRQLHIAETEKYAHVTFFFNGGVETPFPYEDRLLIPSAKIATYDLQPEMSAYQITEQLIKEINSQKYDLIICNFANPDMVGHTGNLAATTRAIEVIDECLSKIIKSTQSIRGEIIITADHGNAEQLFDPKTNQPHTAHTTALVPFIYIGRAAQICKKEGTLADIAPTILYLMNLKQPEEMTGQCLVKLKHEHY